MKKVVFVPAMLAASLSQSVHAALIEDSTASLKMRNFYLNTDTRNQLRASDDEWGQAFMLEFQSGYTEGTVGVGIDLQAQYGIRLDDGGRAGKSGTSRVPGSTFPLESGGEAVEGFGRIDGSFKAKVSNTVLQVGTLYPKLPILSYSNTRLLPQSFEGTQITSKDIDRLTLIGGRIEHVTDRNSSSDKSLRNAGASAESNEFNYLGGDYQLNDATQLRYYFANLEDFYDQHFFGLIHKLALPVGSLTIDLRYFDSDSDGANASASGRAAGYTANGYYGASASGSAISKGEVDNRIWSALLTYSLQGHSLSAGSQQVSGDSDFPHINQGNGASPQLITGSQMAKFYNAGEKTWMAGYAYDFARAGVDGLKASVIYYSGDDIDDNVKQRKEWERDVRVDYLQPAGSLKGLGLTWRWAVWRGNDLGQRDRDEHQVYLNYSLPLL